MEQFGSLGGGNHFIELCLDQEGSVWIMLHSGSRGVGNQIGRYFIEMAEGGNAPDHIDKYLPESTWRTWSRRPICSTTICSRSAGRRTMRWKTAAR